VIKPTNIYERVELDYQGHKLVAYAAGAGERSLFLLNGGPGFSSEYLRLPLLQLASDEMQVIAYDQLGCGESDRPTDISLWTLERYVEEVEWVRQRMGLEKPIVLGHSWGGVLAIEYALKYPNSLKALVLNNTVADIPFHLAEVNRLREALGPEAVKMMYRHEAAGTLDHPEYQAAITLLNYRHGCRMDQWPAPFVRGNEQINQQIFVHMQGPSEFHFTGNLKEWTRVDRLHEIQQPVLVLSSEHDMLTPTSAMRIHNALPCSEIAVLRDCSHLSMYERPEEYFRCVREFLTRCQ
jgi:proline iminopeptidase